jgi:4-aminobutyrate aminotransferase
MQFFFHNGGADAVENAIKIARRHTQKEGVVVFQGSYHGRSFGTMPLTTSKPVYRAGFGPFMPGVHVAQFPYCSQCWGSASPPASAATGWSASSADCCGWAWNQFEAMIAGGSHPDDLACVIIEPVLGEGGYVVPPTAFLTQLSHWCQTHNVLLIVDEVQSGMGRCGDWWAHTNMGIVPDLLVFAKGIANGMPLSGIVAREEVVTNLPRGSMGGTYAGNPLSCAAALAVMEVMGEAGFFEEVNRKGALLMDTFRSRFSDPQGPWHDVIFDLRGRGLMVGVEFKSNLQGLASTVSQRGLEVGLMAMNTGNKETLRCIPSLLISDEDLVEGVARMEKALVLARAQLKL